MKNDTHPIARLERDEFASALKKGLGRAMLRVTHYGLGDVADLVINACVYNQTYDPQCESRRAPWLFRMFDGSPLYPMFQDAILGALRTETETWDTLQLCGLAKEMAAHGDKHAWHGLRDRVREEASTSGSVDDWLGAGLWIELEGVNGLLELARIYGQRLLLDPDDIVPEHYILPVTMTEDEARGILVQSAKKEPEIKAYLDYLQARDTPSPPPPPLGDETARQRYHEQVRERYTLQTILEHARNRVSQYQSHYALFGRHATVDELDQVYLHLLSETDPAIRLRLLWVFRRAPLPRLDEMFFRWADGPDNPLKVAAIAALAQIADERVHDLALSKVRRGQLLGADSEVLGLFLNNYRSEDAVLITQALVPLRPDDQDDAHRMGFDLVELAQKQRDGGLGNPLKWVYENTPCTNCRLWAITQLDVLNQVDDILLHECLYDVNDDIRIFAQKRREAAAT